MDNSEKVIDKLLDITARDNSMWWSFASFPEDKTMPYYGYQHIVTKESYGYSVDEGFFFLATFQAMDFESGKTITELLLGFKKNTGNYETISQNQQKLFELKSLIEYEETVHDLSISDILDKFLNDEN